MTRLKCICTAAILSFLCSGFVPAQTRVETKSIPASPGDTLVVQNDYGRITVRGTGGNNVLAQIQITSAAAKQQSSPVQVAAQKSGSEIYIYSFFSGQTRESVDLDVQVPRFLNIVIWGANPAVAIQGIDGYVRVQSMSGPIRAEDLTSSVTIVSDRGDIQYRANVQPHGDVRLESTSGNIRGELASTLNMRGWLRAGGSVIWDKEEPLKATSLEKQLGSLGPLLNAISLKGNVQVILGPLGSYGPAASMPRPQPPVTHAPITGAPAAEEVAQNPVAPRSGPRQSAESRGVASERQQQTSQASAPVITGSAVAIKVNVDSVLLNVSVRDRYNNRSIPGLQKDDFAVYEDGVRQEIQQLLPTDAPFSLMVLIDVSGSTGGYINLIKRAATDFTRQINQNDRIAIAAFNSNVQLIQDFTNDRNAASRAIERIRSGGGTAFYDALLTCADQYMSRVEGRKAIVVFTDGVDNQLQGNRGEGSSTTFNQLYRRIQELDTIVYTIFLDSEDDVALGRGGSSMPFPRRSRSRTFPFPFPMPLPIPSPGPTGTPYPRRDDREAYETARERLRAIAEQTGGRMYSPKRAEDLSGTYSEIADDLRVQYMLGYNSSNPVQDNRWRSIRVEVINRPEAVARTRKGYYAAHQARSGAS